MASVGSPIDLGKKIDRPEELPIQYGGRRRFFCTLFGLLEHHQIRYCVLHAWEGLPDQAPSDVDFALHPDDVERFPRVVQALIERGYLPVRDLTYSVNAHRYDFVWFDPHMSCAGVDVIWEYREGILTLMSGESLLARRRKHLDFWISGLEVEFAYMLAKRAHKRSISSHQKHRLMCLVDQLGLSTAMRVAGETFGKTHAEMVVRACKEGWLEDLLYKLHRIIQWRTILRNPWVTFRNMFNEASRLARRCFQPVGLFVVLFGPDGVGKSTVVEHLARTFSPVFSRCRTFHWRPMLLGGRSKGGPETTPRGRGRDPAWWSTARLFLHILDYRFGYWLVIRPLLTRSGLIIFDRYFHDLLVDAERYRYGAPRWLTQIMSRLVPRPDLVIVLDASDNVIFSRKQETAVQEVQRLRTEYLHLASRIPSAYVVPADGTIEETGGRVSRLVVRYLAHRLQHPQGIWAQPGKN